MGSIAFDRAADYYDRTRELPAAAQTAIIAGLRGELAGRGRCLEIGVGTGRMALDLHRAGVAMAGVDLSRPMLDKLVAKAGGTAPFPLAVADATVLPFADDRFDAGVVCHVLHLIPAWRTAVEELLRVVRPGGVLLMDFGGGDSSGFNREVNRYFFAQTPLGRPERPGLRDMAELDALLTGRGLRKRDLPPVVERVTLSLEYLIAGLEAGTSSRCWTLDDDQRRVAAEATRAWARERWGALDEPRDFDATILWRAYDLPEAG